MGAFIPSVRPVLILGILVVSYDASVQTVVGLTGTYFGLALVLVAGFTVSAIFRLSRLKNESVEALRAPITEEFRLASGAAVSLGVFAAAGGFLLPLVLSVDPVLFRTYWFGAALSLLILPFSATLLGVYQTRNRDGENLAIAVTAALFQVLVAVSVVAAELSSLNAVLVIGVSGVVSDVGALVYRLKRLGFEEGTTRLVLADSVRLFVASPIHAIRELPSRLKPALDGLVLMTVFTVAGTVAAASGPRDGAVVVLVVALMRAVVIPLKQFGLVGGRLIAQAGGTLADDRARFLQLTAIATGILVSIAASLLVVRAIATPLSLIPWMIVSMMALQLCMEPVTGFGFGAQKVLTSPTFGLKSLVVISLGLTIPALLTLWLLGLGSAESIWAVVFLGRLVFFSSLVIRLANLSSASQLRR
ncbi:hypothetical protein [Salinibacterium sp. SWN248]|uniref:hypothetical protein n=1 Tax=Salinibacterium sp. SWN248 TaxID=2792056 RepID=UPI0018CF7DCC|nr:hypothetical protein [Salinibacterium sp. SWN248]MBH0023925.1 hypothetical protein [Salinibacterium sp. SWN248]